MLSFELGKFIDCYFKIGIVIFVCLLMYDMGLFYLSGYFVKVFINLKRKALYYPRILICICKFEKSIHSIIYSIRLKWIKYSNVMSDERELKLYEIIRGNIIKSIIIALFRFFILSKFAILTLMITSIFYFKISVKTFLSNSNLIIVKEFYEKMYMVASVNLDKYFPILPSFIITLTIIVSAYYVSLKYKYHLAVKEVNKEYLVNLAKIHKELNKHIANLVYEGAKNLSRALEIIHNRPPKYAIKDMIIKDILCSISYYIDDVRDSEVKWSKKKNYCFNYEDDLKEIIPNGFNDIEAIDEIYNILKKSKIDSYYYELQNFSVLNRKILKFSQYRIYNKNSLNKILLTKTGIYGIIQNSRKNFEFDDFRDKIPSDDDIDYFNELILKERDTLRLIIDNSIIEGIELLLDLEEYVNATNKIFSLNSKKWSDIIGQILGFNK